ncbi:MAG: hypothetical protein AAFY66_18780 [Pseudomonadota bacterium]
MTEMTHGTVALHRGPWLRDPGPRRTKPANLPGRKKAKPGPHEPYGTRVNTTAFVLSVVATPLLIGIVGIPLIFPPFAAVFGLPVYLIAGVPAFWMLAQRMHRNGLPLKPWRFALVGFLTNLFTPAIYALCFSIAQMKSGDQIAGALPVFWYLGALFSPLFGAVFGSTYKYCARRLAA